MKTTYKLIPLHEWTKLSGSHKDEQGKYSLYECDHCHETVRYYEDLTWSETIAQEKVRNVCTTQVSIFNPVLVRA